MNQPHVCIEKDSLVAHLYEECDELERRRVERHLDACATCAAEFTALLHIRESLASWTLPESALGFRLTSEPVGRSGWRVWRPPVWAQALAAVLVLAVAAGVANLEVRYGGDGLVVRTGWQPPARTATPVAPSGSIGSPWRPELTALEQQLRREFSLARRVDASDRLSVAAAKGGRAETASDGELLRRVRALVEDSERKQQRELALRVAQLYREVDVQRRADLLRIEQNFGQIEGQTGAAIAQQRDWLNNLVRASQRR